MIEKIVKEVIKEDAREEALEILNLSTEVEIDEFIKFYDEYNYNICCLHLDFLKGKLVKEGKLTQKETDQFNGDIFI